MKIPEVNTLDKKYPLRGDRACLRCRYRVWDPPTLMQMRASRPHFLVFFAHLQDAFLLHLLELVGVDHVGSAFVFAGGLVVAAGDFVFLVAGEAVLLDILVA